jgi:hypothetical protein
VECVDTRIEAGGVWYIEIGCGRGRMKGNEGVMKWRRTTVVQTWLKLVLKWLQGMMMSVVMGDWSEVVD